MIFKGYLFSILYACLCLVAGFGLYKLGVDKKITRKIVHIFVGFEWVILYRFFGCSIHFLFICLFFLILLAISHRKKLMPMLSSEGDNAPGTVYYALAMSIMALITLFLPNMILPFGIGVFCTSFGDGLAGVVGQAINSTKNVKIYGNKTVFGTICNFLVCSIATGIFNKVFDLGMQSWHILAIGLFATLLELFTGRGLDNITVTLGASFLAYFFMNCREAGNYIIPIILTPAIIAIAYKKRALTAGGVIAAFVVDVLISLSLGNLGFIILLTFFIGGIAVDKIKKTHIKAGQNIEKRGEYRNHTQVLANSLVAAAAAVLYFATAKPVFAIAFAASLAEAFADTAASGIGIISGKAFDILRMKKCTPGLSGGVSVLGLVASLSAAAIVSLISLGFEFVRVNDLVIIISAGFFGALFDSLLGSWLQIKYKCTVCGAVVEREEHCGQLTEKHSGIKFINNDVVNFLSTVFAALFAAVLYIM